MNAYRHKWIANFWIRLGAVLIDSLLLAVVGIVLGFFFQPILVDLGSEGRLIGFFLAFMYFSVLNSRISGGQTIGKKVLNLRVVDATNEPISLLKSMARYSVLGVPVFLNGIRLPESVVSSWLAYPLALIVTGGLLSSFYLYVFNRRTRQALHDLVVGSFVVYVDVDKQAIKTVWPVHKAVVSCLFIIAVMFTFTAKRLTHLQGYQSLPVVQSKLSEDQSINDSIVSVGVNTIRGKEGDVQQINYVIAQVFLNQNRLDESHFAESLAKKIIQELPEAAQKDTLRIVLIYGFDIGIWSHWLKQAYDFNPSQL
jgi:uncharacterized RDD family membrane protein YckC